MDELKFFEKIEHLDLLIIDDFGMKRLEGQQQNDFEQIIDDRYHKKSLILSSQLAVADWYSVFSNEMHPIFPSQHITRRCFLAPGHPWRCKYPVVS